MLITFLNKNQDKGGIMLQGSGNHVVDYHEFLERQAEKKKCKGCGYYAWECECEEETEEDEDKE